MANSIMAGQQSSQTIAREKIVRYRTAKQITVIIMLFHCFPKPSSQQLLPFLSSLSCVKWHFHVVLWCSNVFVLIFFFLISCSASALLLQLLCEAAERQICRFCITHIILDFCSYTLSSISSSLYISGLFRLNQTKHTHRHAHTLPHSLGFSHR